MPKEKTERRVVVTGLGPLSAIGFGKQALWDSVIKQETGLKKEDYLVEGESLGSFWVHKIEKFDIKKFGIEAQILNEIESWKEGAKDRDLEYLIASVKLALDDSGLKYDKDYNNIGLFITDEHPNFETYCEEMVLDTFAYLKDNPPASKSFSKKRFLEHIYKKQVSKGYDLQTFMYLYLTAKAFGFHGFSLYNNNACASGLFALESAARQIKYGGSTVAIVAGAEYPVNVYKYLWFKEQNLYASDGRIKPFSKNADGTVFGDGASALLLEDLEHAQKRGANIYAEYLGGGFSLEGWKVVFPQTGGDSYKGAINEALSDGNVSADEIDLINPHGVGIKITDNYEAQSISDIFNKNTRVTAFKPYVGHNLGGSALLELNILLLAMQNGLIPATLNCENYEPKHGINLITEPTRHTLNTVMKLSCGFAGYNGAAVFRKLD